MPEQIAKIMELLNAHPIAVTAFGVLLLALGIFLAIKTIGAVLRVALIAVLIAGGALIVGKFIHKALPSPEAAPDYSQKQVLPAPATHKIIP